MKKKTLLDIKKGANDQPDRILLLKTRKGGKGKKLWTRFLRVYTCPDRARSKNREEKKKNTAQVAYPTGWRKKKVCSFFLKKGGAPKAGLTEPAKKSR